MSVRTGTNSVRVRMARDARDAFLAGSGSVSGVRPRILDSWRRSKLSGVPVDRLELPFMADLQQETSKLYLAAEPILRRFAERLADTQSSIVLADRRARVLGRWTGDRGLDRGLERASVASGFVLTEEAAGTNGIGTALEEGRRVEIVGSEHFADQFQDFTCVGSPIRHPMTRQIEGVLDIACRDLEFNTLLLPMAVEIASEIERALYLHASERERALLESFLREVRTSTRPVVSMSEQLMMANAAAARLLDATDQVVLWEQASQAASRRSERSITLTLADGRQVAARCKPVDLESRTVGVVVELDPLGLEATARHRQAATASMVSGEGLVGVSAAWKQTEALVRRVAPTMLPVLFVGEAGTGKTALGRLAHVWSGVTGPLNVVDASLAAVDGVPEWLGRLRERLADPTGSVLLKHVHLLDSDSAAGLCSLIDAVADRPGPRVLSTLTCDTTEPLLPRSLLDRLGVARVCVPPLRHRPEDIPALAAEFLRKYAAHRASPRFAPEALQALLRVGWPGNVRQLENVVRGLVAGGRLADIRLGDLPEDVRRETARRPLSRLEQMELEQILAALRLAGGNKLHAARALGISRSTLYRKLEAFGIELDRAIF